MSICKLQPRIGLILFSPGICLKHVPRAHGGKKDPGNEGELGVFYLILLSLNTLYHFNMIIKVL